MALFEDFPAPGKLMICPYNHGHRILIPRFGEHLAKCAKSSRNQLQVCEYNPWHRFLAEDKPRHLRYCHEAQAALFLQQLVEREDPSFPDIEELTFKLSNSATFGAKLGQAFLTTTHIDVLKKKSREDLSSPPPSPAPVAAVSPIINGIMNGIKHSRKTEIDDGHVRARTYKPVLKFELGPELGLGRARGRGRGMIRYHSVSVPGPRAPSPLQVEVRAITSHHQPVPGQFDSTENDLREKTQNGVCKRLPPPKAICDDERLAVEE